jgi:hypothetical protein
MTFCSNCGSQVQPNVKFCSNCGTSMATPDVSTLGVQVATMPSQTSYQPQATVAQPNYPLTSVPSPVQASPTKETSYFKGEGKLIVKKTEHRGGGRKAVAFLAGGPIGYAAFGRDKTRKTEAEGTLVVTNRAIYCAGNDYPFDRILSITRKGKKEIELTFEHGVQAGGRSEGGALGVGGMSVEIEIKMKEREDCDALFKGLEQAKMSNVQF